MNGIQCAIAENNGIGQFTQNGRVLTFKGLDGFSFQFRASTKAIAAQQLRIFRAAPKYVEA